MKFKSKLKIVDIEPKDIILYKNTYNAITTEDYFQIDEQPKNTCPLIDSALRELEDNSNTDGLKNFIFDFKSFINKKPKEQDHLTCNCHENYKENIRETEIFIESCKDFIDNIEILKKDFETLRSDCSDLRDYGNTLKDYFWNEKFSIEQKK